MKGTFFSADFIKDSSNSLRLLEMNTDTSVIAEQIPNADWAELISTISDNSITKLAVIYKTVIHENLVNNLLTTIGTALPDLTIEQYAEDQATIYPTSIDDADDIYILRFAYDESALFDSSYCKNRLNSYKLFVTSSDSGSDFVSQYYYSSSLEGTINTLTYEVNPTNIPDVSVIPLLAFDENNDRLGYGKGYYDNFLNKYLKMNKKILTVGVAFSFQKYNKLPTSSTDVNLDYILTEKRMQKV